MKMMAFAQRNAKEILRDPLTLFFGIGFPVVILVLLSAIQKNIPVALFEIRALTPGIAVFGLSFFTLFAAQLVAKDRATAFLARLLTTPMKAKDFILGYMLPLLPMAMAQCLLVCSVAVLFGLPATMDILMLCLIILLPAVFFISLGVLLGSVLTEKQVGGICGALLTNLTAWFSGVWFDTALLGAGFGKAVECLPFVHAVALGRCILQQTEIQPKNFIWVMIYVGAVLLAAPQIFTRRMKNI